MTDKRELRNDAVEGGTSVVSAASAAARAAAPAEPSASAATPDAKSAASAGASGHAGGSRQAGGGHRPPMGGRPGGHRMRGPAEKPANFGKAIKRLIKYARSWIPALMIAMLIAAVGAILTLIGPRILSDITDNITCGLTGEIDVDATLHLVIILLVIYGLGFLFNAGQGLITSTVAQRVGQRMRGDVSAKIDRLPLSYFDTKSTGDVLSRITNDVDTIGQSLNQSIGSLINSVCSLVGSLIMMLITNVWMTIAGVVSSLLGVFLMTTIIKRSQKYFFAQQRNLGAMNGLVEEILSGHTVVRAYNGEPSAKRQFDELNDRLYGSSWKSQFFSGLTGPLMGFVGNLSYVVVCVTGAVLVLNGAITFGVIVAFILYIRLFSQPLSQIAQVATTLQSAAAACERFFEIVDEPDMPLLAQPGSEIEKEKIGAGRVEFRHVRFGYVPDKPVIKDFSLTVEPGKSVAIVGPTGAGKTTLVSLLMRFYDVDAGQILIDGVSVDKVSVSEVRQSIAMVLQDSWLFGESVRENIAFGNVDASLDQVKQAARVAGIDRFIMSLPNGYDTVLDEDAAVSAGQRQLITIARAFCKNAPMLVLDEATSSVDTRTELLIQQAMDKLMAGRTTFVIAHRLSTIRNADVILFLQDGDVVEQGTHDQLMALDGAYAELYNSQFNQV